MPVNFTPTSNATVELVGSDLAVARTLADSPLTGTMLWPGAAVNYPAPTAQCNTNPPGHGVQNSSGGGGGINNYQPVPTLPWPMLLLTVLLALVSGARVLRRGV